MPLPDDNFTQVELDEWRHTRAQRNAAVAAVQSQGLCYQCHDQQTGGALLGSQPVVAERGL